MALAPNYLVFDGGTNADGSTSLPRRPSTDDLGGDDKLDDAEFPPNDIEHPTAAGWNQLVDVVAALAKTEAVCKLTVRFTGSAPFVASCPALSANVAIATFTVTDNGTGDTSITWPANTFPPAAGAPSGLTLLSSSTAVLDGHVEELTNGIRVRTKSAGAAADIAFSIAIN